MATKNRNQMNGKTQKSKETAENKHETTRGGTSAQHAKAGHLGGIAPHTCRGRQCSETHKKGESE